MDKMNDIKVSIIIPVYDVEKYLKDCLDSAVTQTLDGIEIICINDGSTDRSLRILDEYSRKYEQVIVLNQKNAGQSSARNAGLRVARGEYIYFLDSDDLLYPTAMERLYSLAKEDDLDDVFFSGASFYETMSLRNSFSSFSTVYLKKYDYPEICSGLSMACAMSENNEYTCVLYLQLIRRSLLVENNIWFYEGITYEDNLFTLAVIMAAERTRCIRDVLHRRRVRVNSQMTGKKTKFHSASYFMCFLNFLPFFLNRDMNQQEATFARQQILGKLSNAKNIYIRASNDKRDLDWTNHPLERALFQNVIVQGVASAGNPHTMLSVEASKAILNSASFRIGRAVTWLPRMLRGVIHAFREGGIKLVFGRTKNKLTSIVRSVVK